MSVPKSPCFTWMEIQALEGDMTDLLMVADIMDNLVEDFIACVFKNMGAGGDAKVVVTRSEMTRLSWIVGECFVRTRDLDKRYHEILSSATAAKAA